MEDPKSDDVAALPQDLETEWRSRGWPGEVLAEARASRVPDTQLRRLLAWNVPLARVEAEVRWAALLRNGRIRFRQVTGDDDVAFRELWANSPEEIGDWDVTVERGPNAFAQFELQERPVISALFDGDLMVACVSFSMRRTLAGGQNVAVRFAQAMRVHKEQRRHGYGNWVRSLPWPVGLGQPSHIQYDYIRARNMAMEAWNRKHMPNVDSVPKRENDVPGMPVTVLKYEAQPMAGAKEGLRPARPEDLTACVAMINRTHIGRDLFRPYTVEFLESRLGVGLPDAYPEHMKPGYCLRDLRVVEREGKIVACGGLWDRGRDLWERWRHRESGDEQLIACTALLDAGFSPGHEAALADLIRHFIGLTDAYGRSQLLAPLQALPQIEVLLADMPSTPETRYLQWRGDTPAITSPVHVDLVYW